MRPLALAKASARGLASRLSEREPFGGSHFVSRDDQALAIASIREWRFCSGSLQSSIKNVLDPRDIIGVFNHGLDQMRNEQSDQLASRLRTIAKCSDVYS